MISVSRGTAEGYEEDERFRQDKLTIPGRGACVYRMKNREPRQYQINFEKYEYGQPASEGWFGGKIYWNLKLTSREEAVEIARKWIDRGELPEDG